MIHNRKEVGVETSCLGGQSAWLVLDVVTSALLYLHVEAWHDPTQNWRFA